MARPSTYNPKLHPKLIQALAKQGLTDVQIAEELEMSPAGLYKWYKQYPELVEAKQQGAVGPDDEVEASLLARAKGYSHKAVKIFMPAGAKQPVYAEYIEHYPPDTAAAFIWLKNRRPEKWRDRREEAPPTNVPPMNIHISGKPNREDLDTEKNDNLEISKGKQ